VLAEIESALSQPRARCGIRSSSASEKTYELMFGGTGLAFFGASALSMNHTTLFLAASRDLASPDLTFFSSK
jgi:hypothetical protein